MKLASFLRQPSVGRPDDPAPGGRVVARYVGGFAILLALFFAFSRTEFFIGTISTASLSMNATIAAAFLGLLGEDAIAAGNGVYGGRFNFTIGNACDAAEPLLLYGAAVLASPVPLLLRAVGLLAGSVLILLLNQLRILTLYYTGVYLPGAFDLMHTEIWQGLFIALSVTIWLVWAVWTIRVATLRA